MLEVVAAIGAATGLGVAAWAGRRPLVARVIMGVAALSIAVSVAALIGSGRTSGQLSAVESLALLALVFLALRRAPKPSGARAALLATAAALLVIPAHETTGDSVPANLAGMAVWGAGALVAAGAARYLDALDARRARSVTEARREQRLSLARDLHDFVAHDVSAIVVQAQAAQVVRARDPDEVLATLERIEQAGQHALATMDRAVHALRAAAGPVGDPWHGLRELPELADRFQADGTIRVDLQMDDGLAERAASDAGRTAYRLVTEALTNVRRHAHGATRVRIAVESLRHQSEPALAVAVSDDGTTSGTVHVTGGSGLPGLQERVEALGGTFNSGPSERGGWEVRAVLPLRDRARPPAGV